MTPLFFRKKVQILCTVGTVLFVSAIAQAASFSQIRWNTAANMPIGRAESPSAVVGGKLYVFGGYINSTYTPTRRSDVYDASTNSWKQIAHLPVGLTHAAVAADRSNIYLAGGYPGKSPSGQAFATKDVWKYNIATNTYTRMPSLPQARGGGAMTNLNGELHFFGGSDSLRQDKADHWVLPLNGTAWRTAAALPRARNHLGDAAIGGKIYAVGGQITQDHSGAQSTVYAYNPATNSWSAVANLPQGLSHISSATFVMDKRIFVVGGMNSTGASVNNVSAYDPTTNKWTELTPLPRTLHSGTAGSINGKIYYAGSPGFSNLNYRGTPVLVSP